MEVEVVYREVREAGPVVGRPADAPLHERMRRNFHNAGLAAVLHHAREKVLKVRALGRRVLGLLYDRAVVVYDSPREPRLYSAVVQYRLRHEGRGRLPVRSGHRYHRHPARRLVVYHRTDVPHSGAHVGRYNLRDGRCALALAEHRGRALRDGLFYEIVAVGVVSLRRREHKPRRGLAAVAYHPLKLHGIYVAALGDMDVLVERAFIQNMNEFPEIHQRHLLFAFYAQTAAQSESCTTSSTIFLNTGAAICPP